MEIKLTQNGANLHRYSQTDRTAIDEFEKHQQAVEKAKAWTQTREGRDIINGFNRRV